MTAVRTKPMRALRHESSCTALTMARNKPTTVTNAESKLIAVAYEK